MSKEKIVPLVIHENGTRRIVGSAKLIPSSAGMGISIRITDRKFNNLLSGNITGLLINPESE